MRSCWEVSPTSYAKFATPAGHPAGCYTQGLTMARSPNQARMHANTSLCLVSGKHRGAERFGIVLAALSQGAARQAQRRMGGLFFQPGQ